jgi:hypothetical protein
MKFHYMIEYKLVGGEYRPIGVWCLGDGPGLDFEIRMLPEYPDEQEEADWIINRIVESGVTHLDRSLLEYHQQTISPYVGMRSKIVETDAYPNRDALFADLLKRVREGKIR